MFALKNSQTVTFNYPFIWYLHPNVYFLSCSLLDGFHNDINMLSTSHLMFSISEEKHNGDTLTFLVCTVTVGRRSCAAFLTHILKKSNWLSHIHVSSRLYFFYFFCNKSEGSNEGGVQQPDAELLVVVGAESCVSQGNLHQGISIRHTRTSLHILLMQWRVSHPERYCCDWPIKVWAGYLLVWGMVKCLGGVFCRGSFLFFFFFWLRFISQPHKDEA